MRWIKKGHFFLTSGNSECSVSHSTAPFGIPLDGDKYRIYFTSRDLKGRSNILWIDVDISSDEWRMLSREPNLVIGPGPLGSFDDSGAMGSCAVLEGDKVYLFYTGWNIGVTVPFRLSIGLAISDDGGKTFKKFSDGPLLDRCAADPYLLASPFVIKDKDMWKMWYVSGAKWELVKSGSKHFYHIRSSYSKDAINWTREGNICIDFKNNLEYAIARPSILFDGNLYKMWYCYRASAETEFYRIGYAESLEGTKWIRKDDMAGISVSDEGWDSEMVCYPYVFSHRDSLYMLYNGNGYGKTGFGYAVLAK